MFPFWTALLVLKAGGSLGGGLPDFEIAWSEASPKAGGGKGLVQLQNGDILATRTTWGAEASIVCARSEDFGKTWDDLSIVASDAAGYDLGDGHLIQLPNGDVLYSYRHNLTGGNAAGPRTYSIRVAVSRDNGRTWQPHSTVAESVLENSDAPDALRGLWSSFLLLKRDGTLQCYYDDEDTPHRLGFHRNQWLTMKTWDHKTRSWVEPVTVSRAHNPEDRSRDGMPSVVELPSGELLCAFESVQTTPPFANCIRYVTSSDGGKSWSWSRHERRILFEPSGRKHLAISPWLIQAGTGQLICIFSTDEDRPKPGVSGTRPSRLELDVKWVFSFDGGRTWSGSRILFDETHRSYIPGIIELRDNSFLATFYDFSRRGHLAHLGKTVESAAPAQKPPAQAIKE